MRQAKQDAAPRKLRPMCRTLAEIESIIPALETAPAIAHLIKAAPTMPKDEIQVSNLSGRGDRDVSQAAEILLKN
jgi:tryptophan synthase beta chain